MKTIEINMREILFLRDSIQRDLRKIDQLVRKILVEINTPEIVKNPEVNWPGPGAVKEIKKGLKNKKYGI